MTRILNHNFVYDGYERALDANEPAIRAAVEQEYAERLESAGWIERWQLHREMDHEIEERLKHVAPPWGLYFY